MSLTPLGVLRLGARAALRRTYGYAALRVWRGAVRKALRLHAQRQVDPAQAYSVTRRDIFTAYAYHTRRIRARWPHLDYLDPRSIPQED